VALAKERARGDLFASTLHEAHGSLGRERARGDLFASQLEEARARGDELRVELDEAQAHIFALREKARGIIEDIQEREAQSEARADLASTVLSEAQARLEQEKARADLLQAQLVEAQASAEGVSARATLLASELDDARETYRQRRAEFESVIEAERVRAAAAVNDARAAFERAERTAQRVAAAEERLGDAATFGQHEAERAARAEEALEGARAELEAAVMDGEVRMRAAGQAIAGLEAELKSLKEHIAEQKGDDMLLQAEQERLSAMVASAERERDALLGDLNALQARANGEASRRIAIEEELTKLRVAHNQALAELSRMKQDLEAGKRAPEVEAEMAALKERLDALEKAAVQKDAKIAEQADRINRLTERLVREAGMA
jgi:chromosome segregation ATPase